MNLQPYMDHNEPLSFERVYEENYEKVFNFVYTQLLHREDAEDVTEDTFFKAMAAFNSYDPRKASYLTWLCTIARNTMLDHIRKSRKGKIISFDDTWDIGENDPEIEKLEDDTERTVYQILEQLKPEEREILALRYKMEMDYCQIGRILGIEPKAASKRVERLLKKCRELSYF